MSNPLYPIFLKMDQIKVLIVGGGTVALEKLSFMLKSSPNANIRLVAKSFIPEVMEIVQAYRISYIQKPYDSSDIGDSSIIIGATNDMNTNQLIYRDARSKGILVNIADNPPLCDFYMGGIVTKGDLKIAISTNGKSPTMAKRLRQYLEQTLPDDFHELLQNLNHYRSSLRGDFEYKVQQLNNITKSFLQKTGTDD